MMDAETKTRPPELKAKRPAAQRSPWQPWVESILVDWRKRWPAVFTKPVPLAVGIAKQIKMALEADSQGMKRKLIGGAIHQWTLQGAYLRAVARGEVRRNLDGSEAGVPDDTTRQYAQNLLDERAVRQAERARREQERKAMMKA